MVISTKKGDFGRTSLFSSQFQNNLEKASLRIRALGALDEVNSFLGLAISFSGKEREKTLRKIQKEIFSLSAILAGKKGSFNKTKIKKLEREIDLLEKKLPKLKKFLFPGGSQGGALLDVVRVIARRAEREVVALNKKEKVPPNILIYLNRLSDLLFLLEREENQKQKIKEISW